MEKKGVNFEGVFSKTPLKIDVKKQKDKEKRCDVSFTHHGALPDCTNLYCPPVAFAISIICCWLAELPNAIVLTKNNSTIGIGSGQPSRLDSCKIAIKKMNKFQIIKSEDEIVAASDAFFPFVDGLETLVQAGVSAVIQPSGSIKDKEIIKFADKTGIILVFSKTRHFKH